MHISRSVSVALAPLVAGALLMPVATAGAQSADIQIPQLEGSVTGSSVGPEAEQYGDGAPVPQPFTSDYLVGFPSDISSYQYGIYLDVNKLFYHIRDERPDVRQANLEKAVAINNAAADDPELVRRAQMDAAADKDGVLEAVSDALGEELGGALRDALADNRLPKTQYLLGNGYLARAGGLASSQFAEKYIFAYDRPFVVAPENIQRYNDGEHDFYSTSPSFPSGHTNQATWITTLLAYMLPELGPQIVTRGGESGYHRVVMGVHYPLDVVGGRMSGQAAAADRLNDPRMRDAIDQAREELRAELEWRTGKSIAQLASALEETQPAEQAVARYDELLGYGFAPIYREDAPMQVPQAAPVLLANAHPELTWEQRAEVLRQTATPAGHPLDWQGAGGSWQRLNLAAAMAAEVSVQPDGSVHVE